MDDDRARGEQLNAMTQKLMSVFKMTWREARREAVKLINYQRGPKHG